MIEGQNCTCVDFYSLYQWNARGFKVRKGSTSSGRRVDVAGKSLPAFCRCQVVAGDGLEGRKGSLAWVDSAAVHQERSGTYLRPWYEASETRDRS